ncbi:MAG: formylglycine-generating enzyme family protein, partial [Opitutaceae bacterium]
MKKLLFIASIFIGILMAKAADYRHSVTIGGEHLTNITAVVKLSPTTVIFRSDGRLMQVEIKALPKQFLDAWNISTVETPPAKEVEAAPVGSDLNYGQNHTTTLPNAVTLDLVWISPGTFTMGSPPSEGGRYDEQPAHTVTISKGFWLGKTPVTQGQYQALTGNNPSHFPNAGTDAPVEQVSWGEAMKFCRKLTERERAAGHLPEGYAYMLPTEAQREYACRAGTTEARYGDVDDIAWYDGNSGNSTQPVAQKQPNAWGLYDMCGNVSEWCSDWYGAYPDGRVSDPVGASSGEYRVFRGGGWDDPADVCRSASRSYNLPGSRFLFLGFRLAVSSVALDKEALASGKPADARPSGRPVSNVAPPAGAGAADKVDYTALLDLVHQAQQTTDFVQQKSLLKQFMSARSSFLGRHPDQTRLWEVNAASALGLDDIAAGFKAGQKLLAAGAADSDDPDLQQLMAQLKNKGWLDEQSSKKAIEARMEALDYTEGQNHTVTLPKAVTLDLVWIAPGTFTMGSPASEPDRHKDEGPQTVVTISRGFWLGKTPVTQGQYRAIMGNNPSNFSNNGKDTAVETVSWKDAMAFCQKLTECERAAGHLLAGYAYTLPTEAQWEYACRAGTTEAQYGNLDDIAWYENNSFNNPHPVAKKQPNAWGLYDMLGNVCQWCSDGYHSAYQGGKVTDPAGVASGNITSSRVYRGGRFNLPASYCRSAIRWNAPSSYSNWSLGFRFALSPVLLDKAAALAMPAGVAAPGGIQPASSVAQPAATASSAQLTGMDRIDYNALIRRAREAQKTTDLDQQNTLFKQFMDESRVFLQKHPQQTLIWQLRAASALSLDDITAGFEAGQKLLAAGAADSNDPDLRPLMAQLKNKGWLDEQTVKATIAARIEAKREALNYTEGKNHTVAL